MRLVSLSVLLALLLIGCASPANPESSYNKGVAAFNAENYAAAREQWRIAIDEGYVSALNNLGYLLYYGLGGAADQVQAVALWKRAAILGHSEAQWHLGHALEYGEGVSQDIVDAYAWYRCAVANAERGAADSQVEVEVAEGARKALTAILGKLTPNQFAAAEQRAKQYIEKYAKSGA